MQNRSKDTATDVSHLVIDAKWNTELRGKAGELSIQMVHSPTLQVDEGCVVRFTKDTQPIFFGYVFKISHKNDDTLNIVAYDQMKYLLYKDTYIFKANKADEIIKKIANDFLIQVGEIEDTEYVIPSMVADGQTLLDIINKALDHTLINTKKDYILFDDFGKLSLKKIENMQSTIPVIGNASLLTGYSYDRDIGSDTFNYIKLVKEDKANQIRKAFYEKDVTNMENWGALQYYEKVKDNMSEAQIAERAKLILSAKNRVKKSLKVDTLGDLKIRAGSLVFIKLPDLGIESFLRVNSATHQFKGNQHTMSLGLGVI